VGPAWGRGARRVPRRPAALPAGRASTRGRATSTTGSATSRPFVGNPQVGHRAAVCVPSLVATESPSRSPRSAAVRRCARRITRQLGLQGNLRKTGTDEETLRLCRAPGRRRSARRGPTRKGSRSSRRRSARSSSTAATPATAPRRRS
jgi:hypothetical protein